MPEVTQSEDRTWRYRWSSEDEWSGGFPTMQAAIDAAMANRYCH